MNSGFTVKAEERQGLGKWIASLGLGGTAKTEIGVVALKQGWGSLGMGQSIVNEPLCLAGKKIRLGAGNPCRQRDCAALYQAGQNLPRQGRCRS